MTNVIAENRSANSLLEQVGMRFLAGKPFPSIPETVDMAETALAAFAGTYRLPGDGGGYVLKMEGQALFIEAQGQTAFDLLNSVRAAEPGRLEKLRRLTGQIVDGNMTGDFNALFKAYGGEVPTERLKAGWAESIQTIEQSNGKVLSHEVLGAARTQDRDECVFRFTCEKGHVDMTYVWDIAKEGRLLGRSVRGLKVLMRLYPSGEREFFTWDGGVRPPKTVRFERDPGGRLALRLGDARAVAR
jgi:hypothetical protein